MHFLVSPFLIPGFAFYLNLLDLDILTPWLGCMLCHLQEAVCPPLYPALPPGVWFGGFLPVSTFSPRG